MCRFLIGRQERVEKIDFQHVVSKSKHRRKRLALTYQVLRPWNWIDGYKKLQTHHFLFIHLDTLILIINFCFLIWVVVMSRKDNSRIRGLRASQRKDEERKMILLFFLFFIELNSILQNQFIKWKLFLTYIIYLNIIFIRCKIL